MKWWHWLILELLILFGITTWIYFFPDEAEVNLAKGAFGFALIYFTETLRNAINDKKKVPKKGTGEEKDKMFKTELDWVSAYKKLKEDNEDLKQSLDWANERESEDCKRIATLEEENKKLKKRCSHDCPSCVAFGKHCPHKVNGDPYFYDCYLTVKDLEKENAALERRIERAKRCMKKLMFIINSDPANYNCKGLMQDAEDFIHNRICNIRQLGEHCISETRCIMCDMEDKNE